MVDILSLSLSRDYQSSHPIITQNLFHEVVYHFHMDPYQCRIFNIRNIFEPESEWPYDEYYVNLSIFVCVNIVTGQLWMFIACLHFFCWCFVSPIEMYCAHEKQYTFVLPLFIYWQNLTSNCLHIEHLEWKIYASKMGGNLPDGFFGWGNGIDNTIRIA